jgi:hypothetical protein
VIFAGISEIEGAPFFAQFAKGGNLERLRHEMFSLSASSTSCFLNLYTYGHSESRSVAAAIRKRE